MKTILAIIAAVIIIALGFAWYIGYFTAVKTEDTIEGGYTVAGIEYTGPYSKAGKYIEEVNEKLKKQNVTCSKGFGIYYDDPKTTPSEKCRSFVGSILEEKDFGKIPELKSAGLRIDTIPRISSVVATFPLKSTLSYMIGPMKVYPVLSKYISEQKYKVELSVEVYDMEAKKMTFIMQYKK
jgi:hypothetical protein